MQTYLQSIHTNQKSFYNKAKIINDKKQIKLQSYNTIVATHDLDTNTIKVHGWYSKTTALHINEFLMQSGASKLSKSEMDNQNLIQL